MKLGKEIFFGNKGENLKQGGNAPLPQGDGCPLIYIVPQSRKLHQPEAVPVQKILRK